MSFSAYTPYTLNYKNNLQDIYLIIKNIYKPCSLAKKLFFIFLLHQDLMQDFCFYNKNDEIQQNLQLRA